MVCTGLHGLCMAPRSADYSCKPISWPVTCNVPTYEVYSPPAAGKYVRQYIDSTVPAMAVGEYWDTCEYTDGVLNYNQDSHRQRTVSWCDQTGGTSAAFDFTLKGGHGSQCQRPAPAACLPLRAAQCARCCWL